MKRRENHEVLSLVDERCASPLAFNVLANGLLACVADGTTEVSITPERPLFPKPFSQFLFVSPPKLHCRFLLSSAHNRQWCHLRLTFHETMNMILIRFPCLKREV